MVRLLAMLRRGFKERIGWKRVGIAASLVIIAFAITTLVRTLKGIDTSLNFATCAAISSLTFSFRRHLSAVLGGGAARRPAWANVVPEAVITNAAKSETKSQRLVCMVLILAAQRQNPTR